MLYSLLPGDRKWKNAVDPMAGIGDMLYSVREHAPDTPAMLGIEIDRPVCERCADRLPEAKIICADAFKSAELVTSGGWDLVITNPPYVRYQLQGGEDSVMPSAQEIRENLVGQIERIQYLTTKERSLFINLAKNYSGFADMAVPAWILCAALVRRGGYLAVVVPETWLNRDYATPIQYLLMKLFHVETVAQDTNEKWFPEALVKTCLVVARRENMMPLVESQMLTTKIIEAGGSYMLPTISLFPHIKAAQTLRKITFLEDRPFLSAERVLPYELSRIVGRNDIEYVSLSDMGIEYGQGLRTGANDFFYVEIKRNEGQSLVVQSKDWDMGGREYRFAKEEVLLALQNRGEIDGLVVSPHALRTGVIYPLRYISGGLKDYITTAEKYKDGKGRQFRDFSAVRPNEKRDGDRIINEWFRLPRMTKRHLPNLCITRVSAGIPECLYVEQSAGNPIVVDANMITLWGKDERTVRAMMAILNSTWCKLSLELICTVMGGGALKVEASHLKKLLIPKLSDTQIGEMEKAGARLILAGKMTEAIQDHIDEIIGSALENGILTQQMRILLAQKKQERSMRT